jgi:hypothetical protein
MGSPGLNVPYPLGTIRKDVGGVITEGVNSFYAGRVSRYTGQVSSSKQSGDEAWETARSR